MELLPGEEWSRSAGVLAGFGRESVEKPAGTWALRFNVWGKPAGTPALRFIVGLASQLVRHRKDYL